MIKNSLLYSINNQSYIHTTNHLTQKQVKALFHASEQAYKLGCPLNRFITIHFDDFADRKRPQEFVIKFLEHSRKWLQKRGIPVAYVYTLENGKTKGIHVHLLIHVKNRYQRPYKAAMARWLPFDMKAPHIVFRRVQYPIYGSLSPKNDLYGRMRYICKGVDPKTPIFDIEPKPQGVIMGRRWGISKLLT